MKKTQVEAWAPPILLHDAQKTKIRARLKGQLCNKINPFPRFNLKKEIRKYGQKYEETFGLFEAIIVLQRQLPDI